MCSASVIEYDQVCWANMPHFSLKCYFRHIWLWCLPGQIINYLILAISLWLKRLNIMIDMPL